MAQTIAVANQKGGVGKTTSTLSLGAVLNEMGHKVLLLDLDPQGSLTLALGIDPEDLDTTIYMALKAVTEQGEIQRDELNLSRQQKGLILCRLISNCRKPILTWYENHWEFSPFVMY